MRNIKKFKLFLETYSDDLGEVLENTENKYILMKGDDIIVGFEFISDCFEHLSELLEGDGAITEEQRYEFDEFISDYNVENLFDQFEIEEFMIELLDKFEVVEPYKIIQRAELEDTPIDNNFDEVDTHEQERGLSDRDLDDEYESMLGESVINNNQFSIIGDINGESEEIDNFESEDEANDFLGDYKTIYNEFENIRTEPKIIKESFHMADGTPIGVDSKHRPITKGKGDEKLDDKHTKCDCCVDGVCVCGDDCTCGDKCDCIECGISVNENWMNTVGDIVGIADPSGLVDLVNGLDYIRQGEYFYGLLSMISIIPYAGDAVAKPIVFLAKAGKMKGVTKALKLAKNGNKSGAIKLLQKGTKESVEFGKFMKEVAKWGKKLKKVVDQIPNDKIKDEERSTIHQWVDVFMEASGSHAPISDHVNDDTDITDDNSDRKKEDQEENSRPEETISERCRNQKIKTFSDFRK